MLSLAHRRREPIGITHFRDHLPHPCMAVPEGEGSGKMERDLKWDMIKREGDIESIISAPYI